MSKEIYFQCKVDKVDATFTTLPSMTMDREHMLYMAGEPSDCFVMILEGRVRVMVGKENLMFESGPFSYFGVAALSIDPNDRKTCQITRADSTMRLSMVGGGVHSGDFVLSNLVQPPTPTDSSSITSPTNTGLGSLPQASAVLGKASLTAQSITGLPQVQSVSTFVPDYSVKCIETTTYLKITRNMYLQAYCASLMDRKQTLTSIEDAELRKEIDAAICASEELRHRPSTQIGRSGGMRSGTNSPRTNSPTHPQKDFEGEGENSKHSQRLSVSEHPNHLNLSGTRKSPLSFSSSHQPHEITNHHSHNYQNYNCINNPGSNSSSNPKLNASILIEENRGKMSSESLDAQHRITNANPSPVPDSPNEKSPLM